MRQAFSKFSIKHKLNVIILGVCSFILFLTFAIAFTSQWYLYKQKTLEELQILARVVSENSVAGLVFQDAESLKKNLHALAIKKSICESGIYQTDGQLFACFSRESKDSKTQKQIIKNPEIIQHGYLFHGNYIDLLHPIILDGEKIGLLYLQADMSALYSNQIQSGFYILMIICGGLIIAMLLANRLQNIITRPIVQLVNTIKQVSKEKNYSLRVVKTSKDELGLLATGFNDMLSQIQERDEHLEEQVRDRTAKLKKAMDRAIVLAEKAQEATEAKSRFLANMSHEIRTPMNGVLGIAEMISETELTLEQRNAIETIRTSGESLLTIINDILDFSKIEAGKLEIENINFNLPSLVDDVTRMFAQRAHAKKLELIVDVAESLHSDVSSDPNRIRQILTNLLSNAIKFTDQGEILVQVKNIEDNKESAKVRFYIRDTGIGMTDEKREMLFQPFTQVDESTTRNYGGTGLGLAISKQLIEIMGGTINCSSQPGIGSEFRFDLTLKKNPGTRIDAKDPVNRLKGLYDDLVTAYNPEKEIITFNAKALLAEDNFINQQVTEAVLRKLGCQVDLAGNGVEAVSSTKNNSYDIIFMDCQMPRMDGYEATGEIRHMEIKTRDNKHIPIIALTANALIGDREKCLAAGMDDYISKPFRQNQLEEMLKRWLPDNLQSIAQQAPKQNESLAETTDSKPAKSEVIERKSLKNIRALQTEGAEDILTRIIKLFLDDTPDQLAKLEQAIRDNDAATVCLITHSLKSSSATLGALNLSSLLKKLEEKGHGNSLLGASEMLVRVKSEFRKTIEPLRAEMVNHEE